MTPLQLPKRSDGSRLNVPSGSRRVLIIGANGAGKTRFTRTFANELGQRAVTLSALRAIYTRQSDAAEACTTIDSLYETRVESKSDFTPGRDLASMSQLEKLFSLLMHDEMANLLAYKLNRGSDPQATLKETPLDRVISIWEEIFPNNRILVESGKLLFSRGTEKAPYASPRLSTGEKTALFYIGSILYAPHQSIVFIDNPDLFLHPSITQTLWNRLESERPDCVFVYTTHDLEFAGSRTGAATVWVRDCDIASESWDYDILPSRQSIPDKVYMSILGSRKPIIFIEGDADHSIDAKFYPLIFNKYTVKSMGSCNKVIEATRSFNDLSTFHHLDSHGIVDRDRRDAREVEYLRRKKIFVPEVAEIENLLMIEDVVKCVAAHCHRNEEYVFERVKHTIIALFKGELRQQALQHTRHRMKRFMECRIDGRFSDIAMLERHLQEVTQEFNARGLYESYCAEFERYVENSDYDSVLRVFNQKSMVPESNVAQLCGLNSKEQYVATVIALLRKGGPEAERIRRAVLKCFGIPEPGNQAPQPSIEPLAPFTYTQRQPQQNAPSGDEAAAELLRKKRREKRRRQRQRRRNKNRLE